MSTHTDNPNVLDLIRQWKIAEARLQAARCQEFGLKPEALDICLNLEYELNSLSRRLSIALIWALEHSEAVCIPSTT